MRTSAKVKLQYPIARTLGMAFRRKNRLRILTYHSIQKHSDLVAHTPPKVFEEHLRFLKDSGYGSCRICDLSANKLEVLSRPGTVILTFDDGLYNNYEIACQIMKKYGFTGTFFIPTAYIGDKRTVLTEKEMGTYRDMEMLSWQDLRSMIQEGFEIGAHSHRHVMVAQEKLEQATQEIESPKQLLEQELNVPITSFAYPKGRQDSFAAWTGNLLKKSGYLAGCTTVEGAVQMDTDLFELPRMNISGQDNLKTLKMKLEGNYDCLSWLRKLRRFI